MAEAASYFFVTHKPEDDAERTAGTQGTLDVEIMHVVLVLP